ncbi:hypothetical protein G9X68_11165 [Rhizobium sp. WYCCWR 11279]|uniref:hypothetical protein n=1 Tax=Rhizobium changzhiense TaxID=2692317 RepID=UPI001490E869|nr:hypothetical protein [Rhizobium changzhiense]NNU47669.1 hypothetical protein [Rhizobium changzhiense]
MTTEQQSHLRRATPKASPIVYWQLAHLWQERYDVADRPMEGSMDPFFFVTKTKNFIPHEYPCRTEFKKSFSGRRPQPAAEFEAVRWWLPFASPRVDLSGFWFRPTRIGCWARTFLDVQSMGRATLRLSTCGGAILFVNGSEQGFMAPYQRNLEAQQLFEVELAAGPNEIRVYFDDLAERDARFYFQLDYVEGPEVETSVPVPIAAGDADALEIILEGMRFDRTAYLGEDVTILFPAPLPLALNCHVEIEGDFMSTERFDYDFDLEAGATKLALGTSADMPADFRHFRITFKTGALSLGRTLGVEICHPERQGDAPAALEERVAEALAEVAAHSEPDTVCAFARLALGQGGEETEAMISAMLPVIEDCHDCADFVLVPLLFAYTRWSDLLSSELRDRIEHAVLNYRYWMDEPGNDVQWYFSENHALLFHTAAYLGGRLFPDAVFVRSGRTGAEQMKVGEGRVRAWLDHFERWEMAEWNSVPYFPIDLKGLTALAACAPDETIRNRASASIIRLMEIVARSAHHGILTGSQGRSYEHTLRPGRSVELSAIARLLWGRGWYGRRVHALPQLAVCIRDHGLRFPEALAAIAAHHSDEAQEWTFSQGENRFAALYHYKTRDTALGTIAHYRPGAWGYQETVLHLRLGDRPEAQIWINHPGETIQFGYGRPSFWGGCGTLPRVHQYRDLAILDFEIHEGQPDFTHAWFPLEAFDDTVVDGNLALARSGNGIAMLIGSGALEPVKLGPTTDIELRLAGHKGRWIVRLSDIGREGGLDGMQARFAALSARRDDEGALIVVDPDYGRVVFEEDGTVRAEGRILRPADWSVRGDAVHLEIPGRQPRRAAS